jgi:hypothetical protein
MVLRQERERIPESCGKDDTIDACYNLSSRLVCKRDHRSKDRFTVPFTSSISPCERPSVGCIERNRLISGMTVVFRGKGRSNELSGKGDTDATI